MARRHPGLPRVVAGLLLTVFAAATTHAYDGLTNSLIERSAAQTLYGMPPMPESGRWGSGAQILVADASESFDGAAEIAASLDRRSGRPVVPTAPVIRGTSGGGPQTAAGRFAVAGPLQLAHFW